MGTKRASIIEVQSAQIAAYPAPPGDSHVWLQAVDLAGLPFYLWNGSAWVALASFTSIGASILPTIDNTWDIGSAAFRIRNLFVGGTITVPFGTAANPSILFGVTQTGFHASSTTNIAVDFLGVRAFFFVQGDAFCCTGQGSGDIGSAAFSWRRVFIDYTNTGTVGAVTIGKSAGRVNIAAAGTSVVVTNGLCTANAHIFLNLQTVDATAKSAIAVAAAGSFTITLNAASTGQVAIDFFMVNAD